MNEIRIAEKLRPVGKRVFHGLGDQVQISRRVVLQLIELVTFENIEHLQKRHAARAWRRHGHDSAISVCADQGLAPYGLIVFKVVESHRAAVVFDGLDNRLGDFVNRHFCC